MSVLSDRDLRAIWPESPHIGPASIDLHIGNTLKVWPRDVRRDPRINQARLWTGVPLEEGDPVWVLKPDHRYLATTRERIRIPIDCAGQLSARSSWGRDGLNVICGPAGWCDPDFHGYLVLELSVIGSELILWPGAGCLQIVVHRLETAAELGYRGKYQGQTGVTPSLTYLEAVGPAPSRAGGV